MAQSEERPHTFRTSQPHSHLRHSKDVLSNATHCPSRQYAKQKGHVTEKPISMEIRCYIFL